MAKPSRDMIVAGARAARANVIDDTTLLEVADLAMKKSGGDSEFVGSVGQRGVFAMSRIGWADASRIASLRGVELMPFDKGASVNSESAKAFALLCDNAAVQLRRRNLPINSSNVFGVYWFGMRAWSRKQAKPIVSRRSISASTPPSRAGLPVGEPFGDTPAKRRFIDEFWPAFKAELGRAAPFAFAHAANESAWGAKRAGTRYNIFGIKHRAYPSAEPGPAVSTSEFEGGKWIKVMASFADFATAREAVAAYRDLLTNPKRRLSKFSPLEATSALDFGERLRKAGYFTDPKGSVKLAGLHNSMFAA